MGKLITILAVILLTAGSAVAQEAQVLDQNKNPQPFVLEDSPEVKSLKTIISRLEQRILGLEKQNQATREVTAAQKQQSKATIKESCGKLGLRFDRLHITGTTTTVVCK